MTDSNAALAEFDVAYVEPSTIDLGDTPDSVIDYIAALNLKIAKLETGIVKLSSPSAGVDVSRVRELLLLLDTLINKSDKYHEALGGTCTDAEDSEAVVKSWSESREVALVAVMNFLHHNREALTSIPDMREAWQPEGDKNGKT